MTNFDLGASWAQQFQEDIAHSVDRAIALALPLCQCGHDQAAHSDRAFIPCIADSANPTRCWCDGFTLHANARREPRTAATSQPQR